MSKRNIGSIVIGLALCAGLSGSVWARDYDEAVTFNSETETTETATSEVTSPSFNCNQVNTEAERVICKLPELAAADRQLATVYAKLQKSLSKIEVGQLKAEQVTWLQQRDKTVLACETVECAVQFYQKRIEELQSQLGTKKSLAKSIAGDDTTDSDQLAVYGTVATESTALNVRSGMGTDLPIIGKMPKGSKIRILEEIGGWYKVQLEDGKVGYASKDYLTVEESTADSVVDEKETGDQGDNATEDQGDKTTKATDDQNEETSEETAMETTTSTLLSASFSCKKSGTQIEQMICGDSVLSDADGRLGALYSKLQQSLSPAQLEDLRVEQKKWLTIRDEKLLGCGEDIQCAVQVYDDRIRELEASSE